MNPALRCFLLLGCLGLSLLDAPRAGALMAEAAQGPYTESVRSTPEAQVEVRSDAVVAPPALGMLVIPEGAWSPRAPGEGPWSLGLPQGM